MTNSSNDQQRIHNYLLNRLSGSEEELFETWILETPGALEQVSLEQAMIKGASQLDKSSSGDSVVRKHQSHSGWLSRISAMLAIPNPQTLMATAIAVSLFAITFLVYVPSVPVSDASQTVYIEQLRSAQVPTVHIQSLDQTPNYQLLILLDDFEPQSFLVSIFNKVDNKLIFEQTVKPNDQGEIPVLVDKAVLKSNAYILKIVPVPTAQPYQFLLEVQ